MTGYKMMYCSFDKKVTAHKVYWTSELQGFKIRYFASFYCGKCQLDSINAQTKAGVFHDRPVLI